LRQEPADPQALAVILELQTAFLEMLA
jgi:hypothetical protein